MMRRLMDKATRIFFLLVGLSGTLPGICKADDVTDWNRIMLDALRTGAVGSVMATRHAAIVQSAVYDAVNGIERRYQPLHVEPAAAPGASPRAAAVQAAYASLLTTPLSGLSVRTGGQQRRSGNRSCESFRGEHLFCCGDRLHRPR